MRRPVRLRLRVRGAAGGHPLSEQGAAGAGAGETLRHLVGGGVGLWRNWLCPNGIPQGNLRCYGLTACYSTKPS